MDKIVTDTPELGEAVLDCLECDQPDCRICDSTVHRCDHCWSNDDPGACTHCGRS